MKKINNIKEMFDYLDTINDTKDMNYDMCKLESYELVDTYEKILNKILELDEKPKRVIDIGSNMNQYAFLFENVGIDYIGIDIGGYLNPYESEHTKFINAKYEDIAKDFKDEVIISNLCVGYLVKIEDVQAKHLITNKLVDKDFIAYQWY